MGCKGPLSYLGGWYRYLFDSAVSRALSFCTGGKFNCERIRTWNVAARVLYGSPAFWDP